uniref:Uncharacterized protein n=1 Tax=Cacopsylla melanoneura TaxID=428564 RepID=A0A8D8YLR5_9HEMI
MKTSPLDSNDNIFSSNKIDKSRKKRTKYKRKKKKKIESLMRYGLSQYGFSAKSNLNSINKLQEKLIKNLFVSNNRKSEILSLEELHKYILVIKYFYRPEFKTKKENKYNLRKQILKVHRANTLYGERLPKFFLPTFLNKLNNELEDVQNLGDLTFQV